MIIQSKWGQLEFDLPTSKSGRVVWEKATNVKVNFVYEEIQGQFTIVKYIGSHKLLICYKNEYKETRTDNILKGRIRSIINYIEPPKFKYEIGDLIKNDINDFTIIDRKYENKIKITKERECNERIKYYKYHCNICGDEDWKTEQYIDKTRCLLCCGQKVVKGVNDIATTDNWMCKYIVNEEDWYKYTGKSGLKIPMHCPECGHNTIYSIHALNDLKYLPCKCQDSIYYTEKFIMDLLKQLGVDYIAQYSKSKANWIIDNKRYDFYFKYNNKQYIIEVNGEQHYKYTGLKRTLEEEQANDKYKYELAIENGIKTENYIVIDFRESSLKWGKEHILNSRLAEIFDLSNIDWEKCEEYALKNIVKEVCDYWHEHVEINKELLTLNNIVSIFGISKPTIAKYLNKGKERGWCNYNPNSIMSYASKNNTGSKRKVVIFNDKNEQIGEPINLTELINKSEEMFGIKFNVDCVRRVCKGGRKSYFGFIFKYLDELD